MRRVLLGLFSVSLLLSITPQPARAADDTLPGVVMLRFSGPDSQVRRAVRDVEEVVRQSASLIDRRSFVDAMPSRRSTPYRDRLARAARELGVVLIIDGKVTGKRRSRLLVLTLRDGDGEVVETVRIGIERSGRLGAAGEEQLREVLSQQLAIPADDLDATAVAPTEPAAPATDDEPREEIAPRSADARAVERAEVPRPAMPAPGGEPETRSAPDTPPLPAATDGASHHAALELGLDVRSRDLAFDSTGTTPTPGHRLAPAFQARVSGELYPLGFEPEHTWSAANLGISAHFAASLGLTSQATAQLADEVPVAFNAWSVGPVFRSRGERWGFHVAVSYGRTSFAFDRDAFDVPVPDVAYSFVSPRLGLERRFGNLTAAMTGRYLYVARTGTIGASDQFGRGTSWGAGADVELRYALREDAHLVVGGLADVYFLFFDGSGYRASGLDGDNSTREVNGARDTYLGGRLGMAYRF